MRVTGQPYRPRPAGAVTGGAGGEAKCTFDLEREANFTFGGDGPGELNSAFSVARNPTFN
ncbi:hypothetical protein [Mycolicibacter longobardus]|uniref:hypothetical protein n=1 Tax=Mycolicibacter longobardus TaxID=1108812 RepID=UPI001054B2C8|nr:hypothetical protein [Mycolicibacter longobardus]MCV7382328.1 hypothetical protein [Mycolicibacter longobardus]